MILNEREKILLNILINNKDPLSIKDLIKLSKIKERTLYREIKNLQLSLKKENLELIKEKSKYKIIGDTSKIDISLLDTSIEQGYNHLNKVNIILCNLLFEEETSIKELSEKFFLSYNTIVSSLANIEKILIDYKISINRKKGAGISLIGDEVNKRILLISILCNEIKDNEFFTFLTSNENISTNPFTKFLDYSFLKTFFSENRDLQIFHLYTDSSIKKILISLNISFVRNFMLNESFIENYSTKENEYITELLEASKKYTDFENDNLTKLFLIKILKTCKLIEQVSYFNDKYSYTLIYKVNLLIKNISNASGIDFSTDVNLASGLIIHIESAIKRYQLKLVEENNDLQDFVLQNYNELYLIIKSELLEIFNEINFSSTELSYIVLHFASSYEQIYRENFVRALVICSSGIGSSKILGSLIRKNIPEIKNLEYSIPSKLEEDLKNDYDLIISTVKLDYDIDYILVPTILRNEDIKTIKNKLMNIRSFKKITYKENNDIKKDYSFIQDIINNVEIQNQNIENYNIKNIILESLTNYEKFSICHKKILTKNLINRHQKSSVVIPNTNLALFHTLDNDYKQPFIIINYLKNSIIMENVLGDDEEVKIFFIMVSPNKNEYTELLGQISIAILDDKVLKNALISKDTDFIKTKLELIMRKYKQIN